MILHIDCNTFYASCEVALHPELQGRPVVVANCNEAGGGIILALTREAKALGLKRGNPLFQVKTILEQHDVAIFPANLTKYVDISRRLMQVVKDQDIVLNFQQYSVDEFFGQLPLDEPSELRQYASQVKKHIEQCTGIPVSCGLSLTYTLAKVATWYSKRYPAYQGVCVLPEEKICVALDGLPIEEVWGIGRRTVPQLRVMGIKTALDYHRLDGTFVKNLLKVNGHRTWMELHGTPCIEIENPNRQQTISHSRTFTLMTSDKEQLRTYISNYAADCARKLRDQHSVCLEVGTHIATNPHRQDLSQYSNSATVRLTVATADTQTIVRAALQALDSIYHDSFQYKRAGVWLTDITSDEAIQLDLFRDDAQRIGRSRKLMAAMDGLNIRYGMNTVQLGIQQSEDRKADLVGMRPLKNETTNIDDILEVH